MRKIVGIMGAAGSGKDTFMGFMAKELPVAPLAFASPIKDFAQEVFGFSQEQLWGPSEERNRPHAKLSYGIITTPRKLLGATLPFAPKVQKQDPKLVREERDAVWARFWAESSKMVSMVCAVRPGVQRSDVLAVLANVMETIMEALDISPRLVCQLIGTEFGRTLDSRLWIDICFEAARRLPEDRLPVIRDARFLNEGSAITDAGGSLVRVTRPDKKGAQLGGVAGHASERDMYLPEMDRLVQLDIQNVGSLKDLEAAARAFAKTLKT